MQIREVVRILCLLFVLIYGFYEAVGRQTQTNVEFLQSEFDFNDVLDAEQVLKHQFQFVISGNDSVAISTVTPSCGCLIPDWDRAYLNVGDTGTFVVGFNPFNRPGRFEKEVLVTFTNGHSEKLKISGDVLNEQSVLKKYPYDHFDIRYEKRRFLFNGIKPKQGEHFFIRLFNNSDDLIELDSIQIIGNSRFALSSESWSAKSGEFVVIRGFLTASDMPGYNEYGLQLYFKKPEIDLLSIDVVTNVVNSSSIEMKDGPKISFDNAVIDLGEVKRGTMLSKTIEIYNTGSQDLDISDIKSNCSCLSSNDRTLNLKPGEKYYLDLILDTSEIDGIQQKGLHFYSNAINGPLQQLMIKVNVFQ